MSIPEGHNTVTPVLIFKDIEVAILFYQKAFGATTMDVTPNPTGKGMMHASIKIGNSLIMMGNEIPNNSEFGRSAESMKGSPVSLYLYVENADTFVQEAVQAGATITMPVTEVFWGDRLGAVKDPFGYSWSIATRVKTPKKEEIVSAAAKAFSSN